MSTQVTCDGCDRVVANQNVCRGRVETLANDGNAVRADYELCRPCMDLMRGAFNPRHWPRFEREPQ